MTKQFTTDDDVRVLTNALLRSELPRAEWTHAAHCAAAICLEREHENFDLASDMADVIRQHNTSVGTPNSDTEGYHETITQFYARAVRHFCQSIDADEPLINVVSAMLEGRYGQREFPLEYYSKKRLFSVEARRLFVEPDIQPLDF